MANERHVEILRMGVKTWNDWRKQDRETKPDLSGADISSVTLRGLDLSRSDLTKAKLGIANAVSANFRSAKLVKADLGLADCAGASFVNADLRGANLIGAYLGAADFSRAILHNAVLSSATMSRTKLLAIDLSNAKGLERITHKAPSSIGIDTIYLSKGRIAHEFLRGAGVPDNFIEFMGSLTSEAVQYYSCFISYSTKDEDFAKRLHSDLQSNDVRCWFAPHDLQGGKQLHEQIDRAIRLNERLLLILTPHSIQSDWVKTEIFNAYKRERNEKNRVLFPVKSGISFEELRKWEYFDSDSGVDLARYIRSFYIPDFSLWKSHDSYAMEFSKLLRDLKRTEG